MKKLRSTAISNTRSAAIPSRLTEVSPALLAHVSGGTATGTTAKKCPNCGYYRCICGQPPGSN